MDAMHLDDRMDTAREVYLPANTKFGSRGVWKVNRTDDVQAVSASSSDRVRLIPSIRRQLKMQESRVKKRKEKTKIDWDIDLTKEEDVYPRLLGVVAMY